MKILVLNKDLMERTVIQQVLQPNGHEIIPAESSETAMQLRQEGDIRFIIADRGTTDIDETQFIQRLRQAQPPHSIYVLLITPKVQDTDLTTPRTITCTNLLLRSNSNHGSRSANAFSASGTKSPMPGMHWRAWRWSIRSITC
jgi:CheY-like chemotaxis protein